MGLCPFCRFVFGFVLKTFLGETVPAGRGQRRDLTALMV